MYYSVLVLCLLLAFFFAGCSTPSASKNIILTEQEQTWLKEHPVLRIAGVPEWAPLVMLDEKNELTGIAGDYIHIIEKELGIEFQLIDIETWDEVLESGRSKKIDVIAILGQTPDRDTYLNFSDILVELPYVIISHLDHDEISHISQLYGKRVSVANRFVAHEWLGRDHPEVFLIPKHDTAHALEAVSLGEAEFYIGDIASASHVISTYGLSKLKVAGQTTFVNRLRFGIRKDWTQLGPILNKVFNQISKTERHSIWGRWVELRTDGLDPKVVIPVISGLVVIILIVLVAGIYRLRKAYGSLENLVEDRVKEIARTNEYLTDSEKRLSEAIINSPHPIMVHAEDGEVILISNVWFEITGYTREEISTTAEWAKRAYGIESGKVQEEIESLYDFKGIKKEGEYKVTTANGKIRIWDFQSESLPPLPDGRRVVLSNAVDITERIEREKISLKELERSNMLRNLHMHALDWTDQEIFDFVLEKAVMLTDSKIGYLHRINEDQKTISLITWNKEALKSCTAVYDSHYPVHKAGVWADSARQKRPVIHNDYQKLENKKGYPEGHAPIHKHLSLPILDGDKVRMIIGVGNKETNYNENDVSQIQLIANELLIVIQHKESEERIEFLANHDVLTRLPNRLLFKDRLAQAISIAERSQDKVSVFFLDLDNFKSINDSLGHSVGDILLQVVATRLEKCVRTSDTISRQGGDEFLIVLPNVSKTGDITLIIENILKELALPYEINGHELSVSVSIGIALFPDDGTDLDTLLKKADIAMYSAKDAGKNTYRFFTDQMNVDSMAIMNMRNHLNHAISENEFILYYQPQIDIKTGSVVGVEALLRWNHPDRGILSPDKFIPVAEDSGLIVPIGEWVLREACRQAVEWEKSGFENLVVAVNLSAVQFKHGNLEDVVIEALGESGLDPELLELELTESILIHDTENVLLLVKRLKALGIHMAIDDFGTGYSSLSYLQRLSVDKLKIDKSFISKLDMNSEDVAIVRAIIQMARTLNLKTIAEGVENEQQLKILNVQKVDEVQGFYFAGPMPPDDILAYLHKNRKSSKPIRIA
ncbi:MAG: EAL domain-containing protein [Leptospirales bacterium]